ncbi:MAG: glycosyltransferase family 39 protein [Betaproteobacteria bacterium]|nr:glycosyltransferase family 39 protein [Betaproteobacteria bacterium]
MNARLRLTLPLRGWPLAALVLAFVLPGLIGHDPWKSEDAIGTGLVHQMLAHGQWLMPHLAGEAFVEDGPLHYWVAAALAWLASPLIAVHDGARLASGAFVLAALLLVRGAARKLYGGIEGECALLALLGCLGLLIHAHETLGENAMLASHALALYAIAAAPRQPLQAGFALGAGIAGAFLAKGIAPALIPALAALLAVPLAADWRRRRYALTLAVAFAVAAALAGAWLAALAARAPAALQAWLAFQARTFALPTPASLLGLLTILSWSAWPAWPLALAALWDRRYKPLDAGAAVSLAALAAAAAVVAFMREAREVNALPILLPLALMAAAGVPLLRRGAANALAWFGAMTFTFFGFLVWLGWFAMMTGIPERIARNFAKLEPGHVPQFAWPAFLAAAAMTLAWIAVLSAAERSPLRSVTVWAAGITAFWGLLMTLWLPWIDYGKTYRPVAEALRDALPPGTRCIEGRNLGDSQRAALDYHAGIVTRRGAGSARNACSALLVQGKPGEDDPGIGPEWKRVWEGSRPRDKERYRLYLRKP